MEITDIAVTNGSPEPWGEFVEFPLVTALSKDEGGGRRR